MGKLFLDPFLRFGAILLFSQSSPGLEKGKKGKSDCGGLPGFTVLQLFFVSFLKMA